MARNRLTDEAMLKGTTNAIAALRKKRKGPVWLIPVLEKRRDALLEKLGLNKKPGGSPVGERFRRLTRLGRGARGASRAVVVSLLSLALVIGAVSALLVSPRRQVSAQAFAVMQFYGTSTNGTVVKQLVPSASGSARIYSVGGFCTGSSGGFGGLSIDAHTPPSDTVLWGTQNGDVNGSLQTYYFVTPFQGAPGQVLDITIGGCPGGGTTALELQYSLN